MSAHEVVYGTVAHTLVFIPRAEAERLASLHAAIASAHSWGELRGRISSECWKEIVSRLGEEPLERRPFNPHDLPGFSDCEWPQWPATLMLEWTPERVQRLGHRAGSVLHGSYLELDPAREGEVVRVLEEEGFRCEEDRDLVLRACGSESWGLAG